MAQLEDYKHLECEANAHISLPIRSAYGNFPRGHDVRRILAIINREALDQLEPWQTYDFTYISPDTVTNPNKP